MEPYPHYMPSSSTQQPLEYAHNINLNSPFCLDTPNDVHINVVAGVHNEEVGDFSENEDDILAQHAENEDIDMRFYDPPSHFRNITSNNMDNVDDEFVNSMSRSQSYLVPEANNLQEGMEFPTKEMAMRCIKEYHMNKAPDFMVEHSDTTRWVVRCVNENCMWRCRVILSKKSHVWKITKLQGLHTCASTVISQDHRQLSSSFICESILQMVKEDPTISIPVIIVHIRTQYTYTTTYRKAWMAKQKAIESIYGNWEESYKELPKWLCAFKQYLPGTVIDVETTPFIEDGHIIPGKAIFKRLFWSFKPCIEGFAYCKPVISVDGTWLYGKYRGTLLIAIAQDGMNNAIPIAYALVEGETSDIPKEQWLQAHDGGRRWGHMTTILSECINNVLKGTRNLPISSLVRTTYYRSTEIFVVRGRKAQAMMASGWIYSDKVMENIAKERTISNTHQVYIHNRGQSIFSVTELVRPTSGRPTGTFKVDLEKRWCDCGEFQALHYPCSHVIAACSAIHHDYMVYVSPHYTLQYVFDTYKNEFQAIPLQSYWPEYNGMKLN